MSESPNDAPDLGLVYEDRLPLHWCKRDDPGESDLSGAQFEQAGRMLQMLTLTQEHAPEPVDDESERSTDMARIEAKVDLVLNLLSHLVMSKDISLKEYRLRLSSRGVSWQVGDEPLPEPNQTLWVDLYLDAQTPWPLRLPARVSGHFQEHDKAWIQLVFESLPETLTELLDKMIFRHHRRQVARLRSKG